MDDDTKNTGNPDDVSDETKDSEGDVSGYAMNIGMSLGSADVPVPFVSDAQTLVGSGEGKPQPPTMPPVLPPSTDPPEKTP